MYVGSKAKIASWVAGHILARARYRPHYLEPFVGSGSVFRLVAPSFPHATASDIHTDLILMWKAVAEGWVPPETVTEAEYETLKRCGPSAMRGFVGFQSSFGAKWFGGYVRSSGLVDRAEDAHRSYLRKARLEILASAAAFQTAHVVCKDYRHHEPNSETVVYCDPPYASTLGYGSVRDSDAQRFDTHVFWDTMNTWHDRGAIIVVSELEAPEGWVSIGERDVPTKVALHRVPQRTEKLFVKDDIPGR